VLKQLSHLALVCIAKESRRTLNQDLHASAPSAV